MSFLHPALVALPVLLLVGVPVVIHLINLLRHRRVKWAAMEFLLASQRKNRTRVLLRQLLLIALRMAAVAATILLLAELVLTGGWAQILSGSRTSHIVLVDDTLSMSARTGGVSELDRGRTVVDKLAGQISRQSSEQWFTLLSWSKAAQQSWDPQHDLIRISTADRARFMQQTSQARGELDQTPLAFEPAAALSAVEHLTAQAPADETTVVHLVTDYRASQWQDAPALHQRLAELANRGVQLHLVQCAPQSAANLCVTDLAPEPGTRAAGVPLLVRVTVTNHGPQPVKNVPVNLEFAVHAESLDPAASPPGNAVWTKLPPVTFESIKPGASATERFQVRFPIAGRHVLRATLDAGSLAAFDATELDNVRHAVVPVTLAAPVLIVDGTPQGTDAFFVATVLQPGGTAKTGLNPVVKPASALAEQSLDEFAAVWLLNTGWLEQSTVQALEGYVRRGGGVVFFLGPNTNRSAVNDGLYRQGEGLFPAPLLGPSELPPDATAKTSGKTGAELQPDLRIETDGFLQRLAGDKYAAQQVRITQFWRLDPSWTAGKEGPRVTARLRDGSPLVLERSFGKGRVVAVLTTAGRTWNDWATQMTYPILLHELQGWLASARQVHAAGTVGTTVELALPAQRAADGDPVTIRTPYPASSPWNTLQRKVARSPEGTLSVALGRESYRETAVVGVYAVELPAKDGRLHVERLACDVDPRESNLTALDGRQLATALDGIAYTFHTAADVDRETGKIAGVNASAWLLGLLAAVLALEQIVSYFASYHPPRTEGTR